MYVTSFGIPGIGGGVSILIGSLLLVDTLDPAFLFDKEYGISMWTIIPSIVMIAAFFVFVSMVVMKAYRRRSITGVEGMVDEECVVTEAIPQGGSGKVFLHGEYWFAESDLPLQVGARARVVKVGGMTVRVEAR
jgi:membrane-bound serine protease (ClpP class)